MSERERVYRIEVCAICGCHLNDRYNRAGGDGSARTGRCGVNPDHWSAGGDVVLVTPLPAARQTASAPSSIERLTRAGVIPA